MTIHRIPAVLALGLAAALAGCGTTQPTTRQESGADAETVVSERAVARWEALIAGKPDQAYEYLSPGVRSTINREKYVADMSARPVKWISAKVYEAACEADSCALTIELEYQVQIPAMGVGKVTAPAHVLEHWVRLKRDWYHVPEANLKGES